MKNAKEIIQDWPDDERDTTQVMIDQYGEPDESTPTSLIWRNRTMGGNYRFKKRNTA